MNNRDLRRYIRKVFKKLGYGAVSIYIDYCDYEEIRVFDKHRGFICFATRAYFENLYYKGRFCE